MSERNVEVLIVGGGVAGLISALALAQLGANAYLVSARAATSPLPKAHILNQRTMEIFRGLGVDDEVYSQSTPAKNMVYTGFYAGFAGEGADCGRRLYRLEAFGAGGMSEAWRDASACLPANLPQSRLEPILRRKAEQMSPGAICYGHELLSVEQDSEGVHSVILDHQTRHRYTVHSKYLLAADGGRTVGPSLGVAAEGLTDLGRMVTLHLSADLSAWAKDDDVLLRFHRMPTDGRLVIIAPMGPTQWGPRSEEWCIHLSYPMDDPRSLDDETVVEDLHATLGVDKLDGTVHVVSRWIIEGTVAERFCVGRIFLLGDAAHRHPPTGGLGLNSAVHDAHNLAWKLGFVLRGVAAPTLLASYEAERKAVSARNVQRSVENTVNHLTTNELIGVLPTNSPDLNWTNVGRLWSQDPADHEHRRRVMQAFARQSMEFNEHNVEYGYTYHSGAVLDDGTDALTNPDPIRIYLPVARPGHPLPHCWLATPDGGRVAVMDLVPPGRLLLIAGEEGQAWIDAAQDLARSKNIPIDAIRIGHADGDYLDFRSTWTLLSGHGEQGAILVRPDRFVAWRTASPSADPASELDAAIASVLGLSPSSEGANRLRHTENHTYTTTGRH
jgi:2,4-dichlorophenol 6-monooxygenase